MLIVSVQNEFKKLNVESSEIREFAKNAFFSFSSGEMSLRESVWIYFCSQN